MRGLYGIPSKASFFNESSPGKNSSHGKDRKNRESVFTNGSVKITESPKLSLSAQGSHVSHSSHASKASQVLKAVASAEEEVKHEENEEEESSTS